MYDLDEVPAMKISPARKESEIKVEAPMLVEPVDDAQSKADAVRKKRAAGLAKARAAKARRAALAQSLGLEAPTEEERTEALFFNWLSDINLRPQIFDFIKACQAEEAALATVKAKMNEIRSGLWATK